MEVQISYFSKARKDGNEMTLEQRICEVVKAANGKEITLTDDGGSVIAVCSNEEELRSILEGRGLL